MANYKDIQHRFCNKQEGKHGRICAGNVRYEGRSFYSYETVFGQWVDLSMNVCVIFDGHTSRSSQRHKLRKGLFPEDVNVFPIDLESNYSYYNHCNLVGTYTDNDAAFTVECRYRMIRYYVSSIYEQFEALKDGNKKGLENVSLLMWDYVVKLTELYKDTTLAGYRKWETIKEYKKLTNILLNGVRDIRLITNTLFGDETYEAYMARTERFRKADRTRQQITELAHRLGIRSPYETEWNTRYMPTDLTAGQIRKLTAAERLAIHWKSLNYAENVAKERERKEKHLKNWYNAFQFVTGYEAKPTSTWDKTPDRPTKVRNRFTGEEYNLRGTFYRNVFWCETALTFEYEGFRLAPNKDDWMQDFYIYCKEVADNLAALSILERIGAHCKEKECWYDDNQYLDDDFLRENTTDEEYALCVDFIERQNKYFADKEARRRAAAIARLQREEEERKEREHMEQVKQEQIDECLNNGLEGRRDLWRKHLMSIGDAEDYNDSRDDSEFFLGGNVLLRLNLNKDKLETSKGIRIPVEICKKMWKIVAKWHENPSCFKSIQIDTKGSGKYTISSYENDILTAGCHKIAYCEMERVINEIIAAV